MANELFHVHTKEIANLYFTFMQVMMTEHAWYAPMKVAMTVYRCSPNKLATCRFVMRRTKPASETRLRAGISNHGNAEKKERTNSKPIFKARFMCGYLTQTVTNSCYNFKLFKCINAWKKKKKCSWTSRVFYLPPTTVHFKYFFMDRYIYIYIWHNIGFFMNIARCSTRQHFILVNS